MDDDDVTTGNFADADDDSRLINDFSSPFSEPDDQEDHLPLDHPATDTGIDSHELYDEGLAAAAEVDLPPDDK